MTSKKRTQLVLDPAVHIAFQRYLDYEVRGGSHAFSLTIQGFIIDKMREKGYWPPTENNEGGAQM